MTTSKLENPAAKPRFSDQDRVFSTRSACPEIRSSYSIRSNRTFASNKRSKNATQRLVRAFGSLYSAHSQTRAQVAELADALASGASGI